LDMAHFTFTMIVMLVYADANVIMSYYFLCA